MAKKNLKEVAASFGVNASVADAVGGTMNPPGSPNAGDKAGHPSLSPSELKLSQVKAEAGDDKDDDSKAAMDQVPAAVKEESETYSKAEMIGAFVDHLKGLTTEEMEAAFEAVAFLGGQDGGGKSAEEKTNMMHGVHGVKEDDEKDGEDDDKGFDFNFDKKKDDDDDSDEDGDKDGDDDKDDDKKDKAESFSITKEDLNLADDVKVLFNDASLTEEFKVKAAEIFEAIVVGKVNSQLQLMQSVVEAEVKERATEKLYELADRINTYLGYVTEQWMTENAVAIEAGLQREIVEEFIGGLHTLFSEHYISIPEDKEDVVEKLVARNAELEEQLNAELTANAEQKTMAEEVQRAAILKEAAAGLTQVQAAKIVSIAEGLAFTTGDAFQAKVTELRESYFPADQPIVGTRTLEEGQELEESVVNDGTKKPVSVIDRYAAQISRDAARA
jgi:hypothetical protein